MWVMNVIWALVMVANVVVFGLLAWRCLVGSEEELRILAPGEGGYQYKNQEI